MNAQPRETEIETNQGPEPTRRPPRNMRRTPEQTQKLLALHLPELYGPQAQAPAVSNEAPVEADPER